MAESEGRSGEGVEDGGVGGWIIAAAVALHHGEDVELVHVLHTDHNGQPFVIRDVLELQELEELAAINWK